jgi:hypothetical protein
VWARDTRDALLSAYKNVTEPLILPSVNSEPQRQELQLRTQLSVAGSFLVLVAGGIAPKRNTPKGGRVPPSSPMSVLEILESN